MKRLNINTSPFDETPHQLFKFHFERKVSVESEVLLTMKCCGKNGPSEWAYSKQAPIDDKERALTLTIKASVVL